MYHKSQKILYQPPTSPLSHHPHHYSTNIPQSPTKQLSPVEATVLFVWSLEKSLLHIYTLTVWSCLWGVVFLSVCVCVCLVCNVPHSSYAEQRKGQWPHFTRGARGGWWRAKWLMAEGEKAKQVDVPREHPLSRSRYLQRCHVSILVTTCK